YPQIYAASRQKSAGNDAPWLAGNDALFLESNQPLLNLPRHGKNHGETRKIPPRNLPGTG
ncbi:MAG: hypothetical protein QM537_06985, partial [Candidatus Symbiobacter sp.]|nr:hypothetical protein [Candidatus Symbiobacter sp.]